MLTDLIRIYDLELDEKKSIHLSDEVRVDITLQQSITHIFGNTVFIDASNSYYILHLQLFINDYNTQRLDVKNEEDFLEFMAGIKEMSTKYSETGVFKLAL